MKKWIIILLAAGLSSCIYPYKAEIESDPEEILVVDGHILVDGVSSIRLSYLTPLNGNVSRIPRGNAWIEDDLGNEYRVGNDFLTNNFEIDTPVRPGAGQYRAVVEVDGEKYTSAWITPDPAPTVTGIHFKADENSVYVFADLKPGVQNTGYAGILLEETWEFHAEVFPEEFINPETWEWMGEEDKIDYVYPYFWCFRSMIHHGTILIDYNKLAGETIREVPVRSFLRTDSRNHRRYSILVKAFALSKDAYEYNRQTQEMSQIGGDLFSPDPGALEGNLICESHPEKEVMGYVQAGYVCSRRAFLDNIYQRTVIPTVEYARVSEEDMPLYYFEYNFRPVKRMAFGDGVVDIGWAPHRCINCLVAGGTQEVPAYWNSPEEKEDY